MNKIIILIFTILLGVDSHHINPDAPAVEITKSDNKTKKSNKDKEKTFENSIKDMTKIPGLFTMYFDENKNIAYIEVKPEQLKEVFLCNMTRQSGDGMMFDSGSMLNEFPFYFNKVGQRIQLINKNISFRSDNDIPGKRAVEQSFSNSVFSSSKIIGEPNSETGAYLINLKELFLKDFNDVSYVTGERKMKYSFDKENSYFNELKSFPFNTEIDIMLHFKNSKPNDLYTLPDSKSMFHRYHFSLSQVPDSDYIPRVADDRVGHFLTIFQDYSDVLEETAYKRYINRWNLKKANPQEDLSEPEVPIVFWLENTIPEKFRPAMKEGALLWNKAFEKIGIKNAIVVKEMPDDADWDPADVRYNTIRWIITPGGGYAVGPSRANPYTGELYDADIRVSSDYVRWYGKEFEEWITPLSSEEEVNHEQSDHSCNYGKGKIEQMAFGWSVLSSRGFVNQEDKEKFIHDGLVDLIAHEVGHTLGLRHNFKASSIYSLFDLKNKVFTEKNGVTGSVMDYNPVNLSPKGEPQGSWYHTTLGKYDYWAIEYAYSIYDPDLYVSEEVMLEKIASKVSDPLLQYGTDEDARGSSVWGMDPSCNLYDLGKDPLEYSELRIQLSNELWDDILKNFEVNGERYQKIRRVFGQGWGEYRGAINVITKYIGGSYVYRDHIGDPGDRVPLNIVPAKEQRRALKILNDKIFDKNAFSFSPDVLNKLLPERFWNFSGSVWNMRRLDYPIHNAVERLYSRALSRIFNPLVLSRVQDNEIRFSRNEDKFTMSELFLTLRKSIWSELNDRQNINSFRRGLQRIHLETLIDIIIEKDSATNYDAIILARQDLIEIQKLIKNSQHMFGLDEMSKAHLSESSARIESALQVYLQKKI
tara:strand:- start:569 stop:3178 length:2610 start_codon:yes stop_codon:yes gene_type:complete